MKKLALVLSLLLPCLESTGQSINHFTLTSGGGSGSAGSLILQWSIGEAAVNTLESGSGMLSQGFLQSDLSGAIPVKLIYFNGKAEENSNRLFWATSEETNNSYFEVQKSSDGIRFAPMTSIAGSGTVYAQKTYDAVDTSPYENTYYRLKQVDYDGTFSFSSIVYVRQADLAGFALYPNPASDVLYLSFGKRSGDLHISIFDHSGRIVLQQTPPQQDHINLKIGPLLPGTYVIQVAGAFSMPIWSSRFVKQ